MIRRRYPYGKQKAFNITYDDGVVQDIRFVSLLNRYGLKGTFNLNSALAESGFTWTHPCGCTIKRLDLREAVSLYAGHEVASHTLTHPYMDKLTKEAILHELSANKANLEQLFSRRISGFAVPFHYYSDLIKQCVTECGFEYARISEESYSFCPQRDYYSWRATIFHCNDQLERLTAQFLETEEELALFQIVGHAYDLDVENKWALMESIFAAISAQNDILPMTTIELITYLKAMERAEITDRCIQNNSTLPLWFSVHGSICEVQPQAQLALG